MRKPPKADVVGLGKFLEKIMEAIATIRNFLFTKIVLILTLIGHKPLWERGFTQVR
jgi:hypothetical protein